MEKKVNFSKSTECSVQGHSVHQHLISKLQKYWVTYLQSKHFSNYCRHWNNGNDSKRNVRVYHGNVPVGSD